MSLFTYFKKVSTNINSTSTDISQSKSLEIDTETDELISETILENSSDSLILNTDDCSEYDNENCVYDTNLLSELAL